MGKHSDTTLLPPPPFPPRIHAPLPAPRGRERRRYIERTCEEHRDARDEARKQ